MQICLLLYHFILVVEIYQICNNHVDIKFKHVIYKYKLIGSYDSMALSS